MPKRSETNRATFESAERASGTLPSSICQASIAVTMSVRPQIGNRFLGVLGVFLLAGAGAWVQVE